ncbi:MAG: TIGR04084 family radical SAM/SPASM domain-containing protein [Thermoplasmata archaeon]|nr:TIGR04084 family radical SAM/SPASM domain-containing protein [Thermoplasmata archaeon]
MLWIVIVTPKCNLKCKYCGGSIPGMADEPTYKIEELADFISKDKGAVVAFYGGEPTLRADIMKDMMDNIPAKKFVLQTNGFFIRRLGDYIHKIDTVLLSIDGREEITDFYRGKGCYKAVMKALSYLRENGYDGEIIARMAVSYKTDIYEDVLHLLKFFPYVHWQLDVVWSNLWGLKEFKEWSERSYKPGLKKLVKKWAENLENPAGIVPFLGIMTRLLHGNKRKTNLPCGAGQDAFAVTPEGKILACPIAYDFKWNILGNFEHYGRIEIKEPCKSCPYYEICGGRCLFAYMERLWGEEGFNAICDVTKFLIDELRKYKDEAMKWAGKYNYPPYNNTTEIIP